MKNFAEDTSVPVERSRAEIESLLTEFGSEQVVVASSAARVLMGFHYHGGNYQFRLPMPTEQDREVRFFPSGKQRPPAALAERMGQVRRSRWRALALAVKAMMVGVQAGILDFGQVFLPYLVWGDGRTTWEALAPVQAEAARTGAGLPAIGSRQLALPGGAPHDADSVVDGHCRVVSR